MTLFVPVTDLWRDVALELVCHIPLWKDTYNVVTRFPTRFPAGGTRLCLDYKP